MLTNCLAACAQLTITVSEIERDIGRKSSIFHMHKSKNHYFYHIFVSSGDAPGAITLNVVCMEREFDAYKLSRCMCPSNYNRF